MKKIQIFILLIGTLVYGQRPVDLVNPLVDAANSRWFFFSSATRPFGMVNLSPDMGTAGAWESGYRYNQKTINFFQWTDSTVQRLLAKFVHKRGWSEHVRILDITMLAWKPSFTDVRQSTRSTVPEVVETDLGRGANMFFFAS